MNEEQNQTAEREAFRAGYLRGKKDAVDRCRCEKTGGQAGDDAVDRCIAAVKALDTRHAVYFAWIEDREAGALS